MPSRPPGGEVSSSPGSPRAPPMRRLAMAPWPSRLWPSCRLIGAATRPPLPGRRSHVEARGGGQRPVGAQQLLPVLPRHRLGQQVALAVLAAHLGDQLALLAGLDALGDDRYAQRVGDRDDALGEGESPLRGGDAFDEGLVDLQYVDRQFPQVAERRVAGAEVVDRQPDTEPFELGEVGRNALLMAQQDALRELDQQQGRWQPQVLQRLAYGRDKVS